MSNGAIFEDPRNQALAVRLLTGGENKSTVARAVGCAPSTVTAFAKKNKALIEQAAQDLLDLGLDNAVKATVNDVLHSKSISKLDPSFMTDRQLEYQSKVGLKCRENLLKMTGILPTHTASSVVQNITNIQQNNHISPVIQQFLSTIGSQFSDPDVPRGTNKSQAIDDDDKGV